MEVLMEQMNYGAPDFQLASFMDGLDAMMISLDQAGGNQQSCSQSPYANAGLGYGQSPSSASQSSFVDVSSGQSPPDSVYNDTLDSEIAQTDMSALTQTFVVNEPWFDDSGNLVSFPISSDAPSKNSGIGRSSAPAGLDQAYTLPKNRIFSEPQDDFFLHRLQQEEEDLRRQFLSHSYGSAYGFNNPPFSLLKGSDTASSVGSCSSGSSGNMSSGNSLSRGRSVGSVSSTASFGVASPRMVLPPPRNNSSRMKPAGEKYLQSCRGVEAYPESIFQQEQEILNWNTQPVQASSPQQQQQQAAPQLPQQLQQTLRRPALPVEPEPEDSGLRLVHLLLACAKAIQAGDRHSAEATVRKINQAVSMAPQQTAGPMTRVAAHFAEALTRRIYGVSPNSQEAMLSSAGMKAEFLSELLQFYEICPYLKFAHFTANQSILEAFKGANHVHVIDFNLNHGLQWPALIQALALRQGGPPSLRLTGIGPPELGGEDSLQEIGMSLAQLAKSVNVNFQFRGVVAERLDDIQPWMLQVQPGEVVAVNSMFQLHKLLHADGSNEAGINEVLRAVKSMNPKVVAIAEQEANHNSLNFLDRFMEALHFYSSMFDSLEASNYCSGSSEQMRAEMYLGREICNVVACEGAKRVERHETLELWRLRLRNAGFQQVHMGPNAFKQASMLLTLFSGSGYRVEDNRGCLTLCWHGRPLLAASAWQC
ncbi:hypothetical protein Mapa_014501 [Marchantia paleacea]|nr:hypothetical protein Mapa_014501 [Marchantia paleacea]